MDYQQKRKNIGMVNLHILSVPTAAPAIMHNLHPLKSQSTGMPQDQDRQSHKVPAGWLDAK